MTDDDKALLDFAGRWWRRPGAREQAIRDTFGVSETRYWQRVYVLLDDPDAVAYAPATVNRLQRIAGRRTVGYSS